MLNFRPRVIPVLLLQRDGLVKTRRFRSPAYVGDPINAVRIFNELRADELVFLDILASREGRTIPLDFVKKVGEEANMPFAVGGGLRHIGAIRDLLGAGAEKVVLGTHAAVSPDFVAEAASTFGSSTISVCIDFKTSWLGSSRVWTHGAARRTPLVPEEFARLMQDKGAGEIIVQSIDRDGTMRGYDVDEVKKISEAVTIPVVALGGAGSPTDLVECYRRGRASALAAGSMFVFHGSRRGVLISYPSRRDMQALH